MNSADHKSPLMALPPELRNRIYRYNLVSADDILICSPEGCKRPALLYVSKQIQQEAALLYYAENHFRAITSVQAVGNIKSWVNNMTPQECEAVTMITVEYRIYDDFFAQIMQLAEALTSGVPADIAAAMESMENNNLKETDHDICRAVIASVAAARIPPASIRLDTRSFVEGMPMFERRLVSAWIKVTFDNVDKQLSITHIKADDHPRGR